MGCAVSGWGICQGFDFPIFKKRNMPTKSFLTDMLLQQSDKARKD